MLLIEHGNYRLFAWSLQYLHSTYLAIPCNSGHQHRSHKLLTSAVIAEGLPSWLRFLSSAAQELYIEAALVCRVCIRSSNYATPKETCMREMSAYSFKLNKSITAKLSNALHKDLSFSNNVSRKQQPCELKTYLWYNFLW